MKRALALGAFILLYSGIAQTQDSVPDELRPSPWRERFLSSQIEALRQKIASGTPSTEEFWQEVTRQGTPLVEPSSDRDKHQLVTFLWRGTPNTTTVLVVIDPFTNVRPQDYLMRRLASTDVWYLTVRMPRGARFIYRISVDGHRPPAFFGDLKLGASVQDDPLNANRWLGYSAVELPGASPQPWIVRKADTPSGNVEAHRISSKLLSNERDIWVYTPPHYQSANRPTALLVLFDGWANIHLLSVPTILDNLIEASRIPATVAVFVSHPAGMRMQELGEDQKFGDFLATELVPWIRARYNVTLQTSQTVVGGQSAGGWGAAYVALRHSDVFGAVLSQSAGFWSSPELGRELAQRNPAGDKNDDRHVLEEVEDRAVTEGNWLQKQFINSNRLPLRFYMNAGSFEAQVYGGPGGIAGTLESNRHMRDVLLAKGYEVHYQEFVGGHDYLSWRGLLSDGLIALIGR